MAETMGDIDVRDFDAITFDCYGTLIDWETGILRALRGLLPGSGNVSDDTLLATYGRLEVEAEHGRYRPYRAVLTDVAHGFLERFESDVDEESARDFASSVPEWPAFPDSRAALEELGRTFLLGVVSNVDDDLFAGSARRLGIDFDQVVTAQQVRSYKPAPAHFLEMERRLEMPRARILHVAQSLYHDIEPARALGYTCVWVNRRAGRPGAGATPAAAAVPNLEVGDLATLAALARRSD